MRHFLCVTKKRTYTEGHRAVTEAHRAVTEAHRVKTKQGDRWEEWGVSLRRGRVHEILQTTAIRRIGRYAEN